MIELRVKKYCQNCGDFEPDVYKFEKYGGDTTTIVSCEHEKRCFGIVKYLKRELTRNEGPDDEKTYRA